jgi:hypothetical protein
MTTIIQLFIAMQFLLLIIMALHDWIHIPPLTNIRELEKYHSRNQRFLTSFIYTIIVLIPLTLTLYYQPYFSWFTLINIALFYGFLTFGVISSWWVPYFFGSSEKLKNSFVVYKNTHHFLPPRGTNIVPNTFHVLLHLLVLICFCFALFLMMIK